MSAYYIVSCRGWFLHDRQLTHTEIVRSINALSKLCVIRLSPDTVHFIVSGNEGREGVQVWS
jgi:hypothetical protein